MRDAIAEYLQAVQHEYQTGIAAEHAYRPALEKLLEAVEPGLNAVNDPRRSDIGAPDFIVLRHDTPIGFVEAKDIGAPLDRAEHSEQMQRYLKGFSNLILTDYLEFRWYVKGEHRETVRIAEANGKIRPDSARYSDLARLLNQFASETTHTIHSAQELASRMANIAHMIRELIFNDLQSDTPTPALVGQRDAFEKTLLPDIDNTQFADMYAQTIAYGLFAARVNFKGKPNTFSRRGAAEDIPPTNPFLRRLFASFGLDLGQRVTWLVDNLADLLNHTDMDDILKDFGRATRQHDPVVHFYETFLSEYDPQLREQRGVYYTPEPVVSYIVRSVDHLLRERFGRGQGLADPDTLVLDPATGTGTFLYFVIRHIYETAFAGQVGIWNQYVQEHLLRRIFGFELLMAPYTVAHMKLGLLLRELGYQFGSDQRLGVYLTNTLEEQVKQQTPLPFAEHITQEANAAATIKRDKPIMVVLGNPPYSGHSANKGKWIVDLVQDYYYVDGQRLKEHNPKYLLDDYVKFIRFGQWRIGKTGVGVLAYITNNSYLDSPTFRGMRQQLLKSFSQIFILNLHGSAKRRETAPDGSPDDNVFDIQQGVAIAIFIKNKNHVGDAHIYYADLWGKRADKYDWLLENEVSTTEWAEFEPQKPFYVFVPQNIDLLAEYRDGVKIIDVFLQNATGVKTHRDHFVVDFDQETLLKRINDFRNLSLSDEHIGKNYKLRDTRDWKLGPNRRSLSDVDNWREHVVTHLYRPFDFRSLYYHPNVVELPRTELMQHMLHRENLGLSISRGYEIGRGFEHVLCTNSLITNHSISLKESNYLLPLYLYPEKREGELFDVEDDGSAWPLSAQGRRPNLNPDFVKDMEQRLGLTFITEGRGDLVATFGPEDVFAYAYAVFHSSTYRERYAEFLKIDFPRLPLTRDVDLFRVLVEKGSALVDLHLLRHPALDRRLTCYDVPGDNVVESGYPKFTPHPPAPSSYDGEGESSSAKRDGGEDRRSASATGRVYINKTQYFDGVPEAVWEFHVGGYQVLEKWLKDRRGRSLSYADIVHYQRVVVALHETLRLMDEIDAAIPGWPLE